METTLGDLVIDLDLDGSPALCKNVLKLAKARYYTSNLVYNVQPNRFCQVGDPCGDGSGGACIYGLLDTYEEFRKQQKDRKHPNVLTSQRRFLRSDKGRALTEDECKQKGIVIATEMNGIPNTIGSQLLITIDEGQDFALDGFRNTGSDSANNNNHKDGAATDTLAPQKFRSVGRVVEDENNVLDALNKAYCDSNGRPYADVRVIRALVIEDPFEDPEGMDQLLIDRGVILAPETNNESSEGNKEIPRRRISDSPDYERPPEEKVEIRISAADIEDENGEEDTENMRMLEEERLKREDKSRAVVLEMLGDLPSADIKAPENVLFVCKLNPVTEDEDLELIFSRFDEKVSVDIVRDHKTGASLQYAFVEFTTKDQATEAYFKMNNALVDDRRIKVDFSQSVSKVWDRFNQRDRKQSNHAMPKDPFREQQQHTSHRNPSRQDRGRNIVGGNDRRRNDGRSSNHSRNHHDRHNDRHKDRNNRYEDFAGRDHRRHHGNNDRESHSDRYRDDHRHSNRDRHHRDRRDYDSNHGRRHHDGRDRDGRRRHDRDDGFHHSRLRDESRHGSDRRRDEPSNRRSGHGSNRDDYTMSDRSETSPGKRSRRRNDDRRRRSRSRSCSNSRSESDSYSERRERHRNERKKDKKKRDRKRDDDKRHHKRSRRDSKHHHRRKDRHEERDRERHS